MASDVTAVKTSFERHLGFRTTERVVDGQVEIGAWMSSNILGHEVACLRDSTGGHGKMHHVAFYYGNGQHNADAAEMFREYDIRIEAGPDRHGITQGQFLYVFEPGGNRIELFGEPGFLHLEPDAETKTWLMSDIDTGLAIGGANLPWETYFTYGNPNDLTVEEHAAKFSANPPAAAPEVEGAADECPKRSSIPARSRGRRPESVKRRGTAEVSARHPVSQGTRAAWPVKLGCVAKSAERASADTVGSSALTLELGSRTAGDVLATLGGLIPDPEVGNFHIKRFAARVPPTVLGDLGIAANAIRMALSRQVQRGLLSTAKVGREVVYSFTDAGERIFSEAGLRVRAQRPFDSAATVWTLASFSVPESRRELRSRLRIHLTQRGFRPLRDGLWVALDSFAAELVTRDLDVDLAENCQLDIFIATPYRSSSLVEVIRRGWDLDDLRTRHTAFLTRWEHLDTTETRGALPLLTLFSADWLDLPQHDPGLPTDSLDDDWPGERSAATANRLFEALQGPAGCALERLLVTTDPSGRNP